MENTSPWLERASDGRTFCRDSSVPRPVPKAAARLITSMNLCTITSRAAGPSTTARQWEEATAGHGAEPEGKTRGAKARICCSLGRCHLLVGHAALTLSPCPPDAVLHYCQYTMETWCCALPRTCAWRQYHFPAGIARLHCKRQI